MQHENPYQPPHGALADQLSPGAEPGLQYAGFWRRFFAYWVDALVFMPLVALNYFAGNQSRLFSLYAFVPGLILGWWFHVYLVRRYGGTPGKLLLGIRVAMLDGSRVTTEAAVLRYALLFLLSTVASVGIQLGLLEMTDEMYFSLGYVARAQKMVELAPRWYKHANILMQVWIWSEFVTMLFNRKRRAAHDFIAGTVVLRKLD